MQLNVPPDLETLINRRLSSGGYPSGEDVLRHALEAQDAAAGAGGPAGQPDGDAGAGRPGGGQPPNFGGGPGAGPGGPQGTNAAGMRGRGFGPPAKPLTADQGGLVRAWIDQGAK